MKPNAICVWGDSIAKGVIYDETRKRYAILKENCLRLLAQQLPLPIHNYAAMGRTAPECLAAIRQDELVPGGLAILEFGGNDSDLCWADVAREPEKDHPARASLAQFKESLRGMIAFVRQGGMIPALVSTLPIDGERYFQWVSKGLNQEAILSYLGEPQMMYRWQERYAYAVQEVAREENVCLLDFRSAFLSDRHYQQLFCPDGIHPNAQGHRKLFECAMAAIKQYQLA